MSHYTQTLSGMTDTPGIYAIRNIINGKIYVGSTCTLRGRFRDHFRLLRKGEHENPYLQRAWNKHGEVAFEFEVLETLISDDPEALHQAEDRWVSHFSTTNREFGYNLLAPFANARSRTSDETRARMSASQKGRQQPEEVRRKISTARQGMVFSNDHRANIRAARQRQVFTEETRRKISEAHKGRKKSAQVAEVTRQRSARYYRVTNPAGETEVIWNLSEFCRKCGFSESNIHVAMRTGRAAYGGWTFERLGDDYGKN